MGEGFAFFYWHRHEFEWWEEHVEGEHCLGGRYSEGCYRLWREGNR